MLKEKTWKQIEDSRNRRLWFSDVVKPTAGVISTLVMAYTFVPEVRSAVNNGFGKVKKKVVGIFKKKEVKLSNVNDCRSNTDICSSYLSYR